MSPFPIPCILVSKSWGQVVRMRKREVGAERKDVRNQVSQPPTLTSFPKRFPFNSSLDSRHLISVMVRWDTCSSCNLHWGCRGQIQASSYLPDSGQNANLKPRSTTRAEASSWPLPRDSDAANTLGSQGLWIFALLLCPLFLFFLSFFKIAQIKNTVQYHLYVESKKNNTNELIYKTETDSQSSKTNLWLPKAEGTLVPTGIKSIYSG